METQLSHRIKKKQQLLSKRVGQHISGNELWFDIDKPLGPVGSRACTSVVIAYYHVSHSCLVGFRCLEAGSASFVMFTAITGLPRTQIESIYNSNYDSFMCQSNKMPQETQDFQSEHCILTRYSMLIHL